MDIKVLDIVRATRPLPLSGPVAVKSLSPTAFRASPDVINGGLGRISGTVKVKGTPNAPVWRRVRLFSRREGIMRGEVWSNRTTGAYEFLSLNTSAEYTVIAYDHTGQHNAVIADPVMPVSIL